MDCCGPSPEYAKQEADRKAQDEAMMNQEVTLNGVTLKVKDLFADAWAARDFVTKLNLLNKCKGGKAMLNTSPASIMDDEEEAEA